MTLEQEQVAIGTHLTRFLAAIAVLSGGEPLAGAARAAVARAMADLDVQPSLRESLLRRADAGVRAGEVPADPLDDRVGAVRLVVALTRLALASGPERLAVPEALAAACRLPHDLVGRAATRLESLGPAPEDLHERLLDFLHPGAGLRAIARDLADSLAPERPPLRSFARVSPTRYQHPQDRDAIRLIHGIAGFDDLTRLIFEEGFEKAFRLINLSSCVRVGETQFPELYAAYRECVARTGVTPEPEFYLKPGGINAHTSGVERPYVMVDSGAVSMLNRGELDFIIGHELGHIRCQHMLYLFIASLVPYLAQAIPMAGGILAFGLKAAIADWTRKAELSCDRVGLLTCQDLEAAQRVLVKSSGVPPAYYDQINMDAFLAQHAEFEALDRDALSMVYKLLMGLGRSHPWTVVRVAELKNWVDSGAYAAILADTPDAPVPDTLFLPLAALADEPGTPPRERLATLLASLPEKLARHGLAEVAGAAVAVLSSPTAASGHLTTVVGEKGRGCLAIAERLQGAEGALVEVAPALNVTEADDRLAMQGVLASDLTLVALDATQLLGKQERLVIQERLLPVATGDVALVILGLEQAEDPTDRAELIARASRFAVRQEHDGLVVFCPSDPWVWESLDAFVEASRRRAAPARDLAWLAKVEALFEGLSHTLAERGAEAWQPPTEAERAQLMAGLRQEHALALTHAESHLAARFGGLRAGLAARLAALDADALRHEGLAGLTAEVQAIGREAANAYVAALERGLAARAPGPTRSAAGGFDAVARAQLERSLGGDGGPIDVSTRRPRHWGLVALTAVGTGLVLFTGGMMLPVVGALTLAGAHGMRVEVDGTHEGQWRAEAVLRLNAWLDTVEASFRTQLARAGESLAAGLESRLDATLQAARPPEDTSGSATALLSELQQGLAWVAAARVARFQEEQQA